MQAVSATFSGALNAPWRKVSVGAQISWQKTVASGVQYFTVGQSLIGGTDMIATSQPGTIAQLQQYAYQNIPASGIVSWQTSMRLDQYPYGLVLRQGELVLDNTDASLLAASGTSVGPYIEPGRPVIISAGFGGETVPMFSGFSDAPVNDIPARTTTLHCFDGVKYITDFISKATPPFLNSSVNTIITTLLEEAGFGPNQFVLEQSLNDNIPYLDPIGQSVGDIIKNLCEAEAGIFFADEGGLLHFWNRQHFANNATPVWTLTYSNIEKLQQQNTTIINAVQVNSTPMQLASGNSQVYNLNQPYYIQASSTSGINWIMNPSLNYGSQNYGGKMQLFGRENVDVPTGPLTTTSYAASGQYITYTGVPLHPTASPWGVQYNNPSLNTWPGWAAVQFQALIPSGMSALAILGTASGNGANPGNPAGAAILASGVVVGRGTGWQNYAISGSFSNAAVFGNGNQFFALSGTSVGAGQGVKLSALSDNTKMFYFDGDTSSTNVNTFSWSGVPGLSPSNALNSAQLLTVQADLNAETYSLVAPVASGLNAANIGAQQSFYSFSTQSGIGGIYGTDLTSSMQFLGYSVSGTTAYISWLNTGTLQGYLTNLVLFGRTASNISIGYQQLVTNQNSITQFGLNPANNGKIIQISNNYVTSAGQANSLAQYLVQGFNQPLLRHTVDDFVVPNLQFGDAVNLVNRDTGETRTCYVLGITNRFDRNGKFTQQLTCQERTAGKYFTIGVSTIAGPDSIAP